MKKKISLAAIPVEPDEHFRFLVFDLVLRIMDRERACGTLESFLAEYPFLYSYEERVNQIVGDEDIPVWRDWNRALHVWEDKDESLPFLQLRGLGFGEAHQILLTAIAAVEEDPRLTLLMEAEGGAPTIGGLTLLLSDLGSSIAIGDIRGAIFDLIDHGMLLVSDQNSPRIEWKLRLAPVYFDLLTGARLRLQSMIFKPVTQLPNPKQWIPAESDADEPSAIAQSLQSSGKHVLHVTGERHNGRKTFLRMAAQSAGLNILEVSPESLQDQEKWREACLIAHLTGSMLLAEIECGPGQSCSLPGSFVEGLIVTIAGPKTGSVDVPGDATAVRIILSRPDEKARAAHWKNAGLGHLAGKVKDVMLTSGNIYRASNAAKAIAKIEGKSRVVADQVYRAAKELSDGRLDAIAARIVSKKKLDALYLDKLEQEELDALVLRCSYREQLHQNINIGVKAILSGPSGTGKTLAAQHVAARLNKQLYRIDLSATVNKFIGETEKGLERALSAAEEMDVVLLLDEGDALMARRTDVSSSTDRYANLETNFLLQRLESFSGIILVTTNDGDRIDSAFSRRMDAIIPFRLPDEMRRLEILKYQLGTHQVSDTLLQDVACRCSLSGGQLHNVAVHARLLSLGDNSVIGNEYLLLALRREYRKNGEHCPLKPALAAVG